MNLKELIDETKHQRAFVCVAAFELDNLPYGSFLITLKSELYAKWDADYWVCDGKQERPELLVPCAVIWIPSGRVKSE